MGGKKVPKLYFGVYEDQGKREYMEDRNCIIPDFRPLGAPDDADSTSTTFSGVFDGHLSSKAAEMAANELHSFLAKEAGYLSSTHRSEPLKQEEVSLALRRAFQRCDHHILAASKAEENWKGGTTACVALTIDTDLFVAHVGDSGAFVVRDGAARRLTLDHKPTNPAEQKRIADAGGRVNETLDRVYSVEAGTMLAMSRALGDANFKEGADALVSNRPDVRHLSLTPGDTAIIIASDGLFDVIADQTGADTVCKDRQEEEVRSDIAHEGDLSMKATRSAEHLVRLALEAGSTDNITVLVALLDWS